MYTHKSVQSMSLPEGKMQRLGIDLNQQIEITHDILAKKVYDRIDGEEKMRLKVIQHLRDRFNYHQETGELLSRRELVYIDPHLAQITLSEQQSNFVEKSRQAVKKSIKRRRMTIAGIGIVLLAAAIASVGFGINAERHAMRAEQEAIAAHQAEQEAHKAELEAEASALEAHKAELKADSSARAAQQALAHLESATENIVKAVLEDAKQDIYKLRYEEAFMKYYDAYKLGKLPKKVLRGMMELAFFHGESGNKETAFSTAQFALNLKPNKRAQVLLNRARKAGDNYRKDLRKALNMVDANCYNFIYDRYYPEMAFVQGGQFLMGSKKGQDDELPIHQVKVSDFEIAATETTIWQYNLFCEATKYDSKKRIKKDMSWGLNGNNPVAFVSWFDAAHYTNWLSKQMNLTPVYSFKKSQRFDSINYEANGFRLPTEAEWEYAATGGSYGYDSASRPLYIYAGTSEKSSLIDYAWMYENGGSRTQAVATRKPNPLGLYDMTGNVWEICQDYYSEHQYSSHNDTLAINPIGPSYENSYRGQIVHRGGAGEDKFFMRIANRGRIDSRMRKPDKITTRRGKNADVRVNFYGFRVARIAPTSSPK